jgi:hypothetical protein
MPFLRLSWQHTDLWAKNSERDLLLWEWNVSNTKAAAGIILPFGTNGYLRLEGELSSGHVDSVKYISNRVTTFDPVGNGLKAEARAPIWDRIDGLCRVAYGGANRDVIVGGTDFSMVDVSASLTYNISYLVSVSAGYAYRHLQATQGGVKNSAEDRSLFVSIHLIQE